MMFEDWWEQRVKPVNDDPGAKLAAQSAWTYSKRQLESRLEQVIFERDHANACNDRLNAVLLGIVQLLHPPQMRREDGRIFRFEAENPNALLQLLADKIRAILTANVLKDYPAARPDPSAAQPGPAQP